MEPDRPGAAGLADMPARLRATFRVRGPSAAILVAAVLSVPLVVLAITDVAGLRSLWDNLHWSIASIAAAIATGWSIRGTTGRVRHVRTAGAVAFGLWMAGNLTWAALTLAGVPTIPSIADLFVIAIVGPATLILILAVHGRVTRAEEAAIYLDSLMGFLLVGAALLLVIGPTATSLPLLAGLLAIVYPMSLLGLGAAGMVGVLAIGLPIERRGSTALMFGSALLGLAYLGWIPSVAQGAPVGVLPSLLFTIGTLLAGFGSATWTDARSTDAVYLRRATFATALVGPVAAAVLLGLLLVPVPASIEVLVRGASVAGGCLFILRQGLLLRERTTMLASLTSLTNENRQLVEGLRAELERRAVDERRMIEASRAAAVGELAAGVAHEVNNPLTGVLGFAEILIDETQPDDPRRRDLETIRDEALRAREIVRALRDFARPRPPELVSTDLSALVHQTVDLVRYSIERRGIVIHEDLPPLESVLLDGSAIQQAVLNILTNARQAMDGEGRLDVAVRADGPGRLITITDDGVGMDAATARLAFDPFFSGRETSDDPGLEPGAGLGLSVSTGLIESHGGTITIDSSPGRGTTVEIHLPAVGASPAVHAGGKAGVVP